MDNPASSSSNAQPGPGPTTARIRFTVPANRPQPAESQNAMAGQLPSVLQPVDGSVPSSAEHAGSSSMDPSWLASGWTSRPPEYSSAQISGRGTPRRRARGRGTSRGRGGSARGSRHNPPRHSSVRASTRISELSDMEPGSSRRVTLSFNKNGISKSGDEFGRKTSFLGEYDRDLDEHPNEPLSFEEQFVLRVPDSVAGKLREMVKGKGKGLEGVEFKFLDTRRAVFKFDGKMYASRLVDLPNIIESQKTFDSRHLFKVADISQMLVVDEQVDNEATINASALNIDEYIWPHGITPPLRHVRKRRFRKRLSRRAIEVVEEQVEELLGKDEDADLSHTDLIDINPGVDVPDSYYINYDPDAVWYQNEDAEGSEFGGSEAYEDPGSAIPQSELDEQGYYDDQNGMAGYQDEEEDGQGYDDDLAAALREELAEGSDEDAVSEEDDASGDDEDEEGVRSGDEEEDEELAEKKAKIKQFSGEIRILETTIEKKKAGFTGGNPIMVKRFEETIGGLQADINTKVSARQALLAEVAAIAAAKAPAPLPVNTVASVTPRKPAITPNVGTPMDDDEEEDEDEDDADSEHDSPAPAVGQTMLADDDDDDLFGDGDDDEYETVEVTDTPRRSSTVGDDNQDYSHDDEMGPEIDDEMAALLEAELGNGMDGDDTADQDLQTLQAMQIDPSGTSGMDIDSAAGEEYQNESAFGVEGGVGMRRLATGVIDEGDGDSDSDESD